MIQIFTDGALAYDSRLRQPGNDHTLLGLTVTTGLNKGGMAKIIMPPGHPAYRKYTSHRTIVEIYRDDWLIFRGRALYPEDDFYNRRTVTCEGELCLFQDGVSRPYLYQDSPAAIFAAVVEDYNAQVEEFKRFRVGEVTVTDANDYIRLESDKAGQTLDTLNKLLERCGGYFVFTTDDDGARVINWYAELDYSSDQVIEFGENLLDFARSDANTELATGVVPYGAKDEATGERVGITSVNDGRDYIIDVDAAAIRGTVIKPVYWNDVTEPANLLKKARKYLAEARQIVTSLTLSAVDLSYMGKKIGSYKVGDKIRVRSKPHEVDDIFQLIERSEDLLNPASSSITLGKDVSTLTDASVAGDKNSRNELDRVQQAIKIDYKVNTQQAVQKSERTMSTLIQQTTVDIVSRVIATEENVDALDIRTTVVEQKAEGLDIAVVDMRKSIDTKADREVVQEFSEHFHFGPDGLTISNSATGMGIGVSEKRVAFTGGAQEPTTTITPTEMETTNLRVGRRLDLGNFALLPRTNGNLSMRWTGTT